MKKLSTLIAGLTNPEVFNPKDVEIKSISYDSRLCGTGSLFVAMKGVNSDGHKYIPEVIANGCKAIICEDIPDGDFKATFIKVDSSRQALAEVSHNWFDYPTRSMKVIGVTGTNGKTTTTFLISQILTELGKNVGIIGTTGIYFCKKKIEATHTTPESFELCKIFKEMAANRVEYVIMEVSSHALEQKRVYGIDFDIALFTNLTHDHLDYHSTIENYANSKKKLFESLAGSSIAIVNGDDPYSDLMLSNIPAVEKIKIGRHKENDWIIGDESITLEGNSFTVTFEAQKYAFETHLLGKFNIDNAAIAALACSKLGFKFDEITQALTKATGAEGRMATVTLKTGAIGIVDYSHTPDALEKALKTCREIMLSSGKKDNRLICVFGCGGDRDKSKRPLMGDISAKFADFTIITDDNPRTEDPAQIRKDIITGIDAELMEFVIEIGDRSCAICKAVGMTAENDIVLVAGKGHEKYQIKGKVKSHFDDFEVLAGCK